MAKVVVSEFITLDGVIEGPGPEGSGFDREGWTLAFDRGRIGNEFKLDEVMAAGALLLGRVTYEGFARAWPAMEGADEFAEKMNSMPKYVVSTTLESAEWSNSTIIRDDLPGELARLKQEIDGDILINGSAQLVQSLIELDLIDEFRLMVFPVVLGGGKRLFADSPESHIQQLVDVTRAADTVIVTSVPAG
jgi:dihydrofolate reductase